MEEVLKNGNELKEKRWEAGGGYEDVPCNPSFGVWVHIGIEVL